MVDIKCKFDEMLAVHKIVPHPRNANAHPKKQIDMLAKNIYFQGFRIPLIISKRSSFLVSGHGRLEAAKLLGMGEVPVVYQEFESEAQEFKFLIADNKLAELAEHDDLKMLEGIKDLDLLDMDFDLLGVNDFSFITAPLDEEVKEVKEEGPKKFMLEIQFPNDIEMNDVKDEMLSRGFIVKVR